MAGISGNGDVRPVLEALRHAVTGPVLTPGDDEYDKESSGFDLNLQHAAPVLVSPLSTQEVMATVSIAVAHELPVSIIGGGHADVPPVTDGLLLTTRHLDGVEVDEKSRTATLGSGATWRPVIESTAPLGLAPLSGSAPDVGVGGYLLGGGIGPLGRTFGFSVDHVRRFDVVTADGELREASTDKHPDLFWALRGGKGGLGVVTSVTVDLLELPTIYGGGEYYDGAHIPGLLHAYQELTSRPLPRELTTSLAILRLPDVPVLPAPLRGKTVAHLRIAYVGRGSDAEHLLAPLRQAVGAPIMGAAQDIPYSDIGTIHNDPTMPSSHETAGMLLDRLEPGTVEAIARVAGPDVAVPLAIVELRHLGGALATGVADAVSGRDAGFGLWVSSPPSPGRVQGEAARRAATHVRSVLDAVEEWSLGRVQINFCGSANTYSEASSAWSQDVLDRLSEVRQRYDPRQRFRFSPGSTVEDGPQ